MGWLAQRKSVFGAMLSWLWYIGKTFKSCPAWRNQPAKSINRDRKVDLWAKLSNLRLLAPSRVAKAVFGKKKDFGPQGP